MLLCLVRAQGMNGLVLCARLHPVNQCVYHAVIALQCCRGRTAAALATQAVSISHTLRPRRGEVGSVTLSLSLGSLETLSPLGVQCLDEQSIRVSDAPAALCSIGLTAFPFSFSCRRRRRQPTRRRCHVDHGVMEERRAHPHQVPREPSDGWEWRFGGGDAATDWQRAPNGHPDCRTVRSWPECWSLSLSLIWETHTHVRTLRTRTVAVCLRSTRARGLVICESESARLACSPPVPTLPGRVIGDCAAPAQHEGQSVYRASGGTGVQTAQHSKHART